MLFFDVIYYQTYLFYKNILREEDPHATTTWGIGAAFSFILLFNLLILKEILFCLEIKTLYLFLSGLIVVLAFLIIIKKIIEGIKLLNQRFYIKTTNYYLSYLL